MWPKEPMWLVSHRIMRLVPRIRPLVLPAPGLSMLYSTQKHFCGVLSQGAGGGAASQPAPGTSSVPPPPAPSAILVPDKFLRMNGDQTRARALSVKSPRARARAKTTEPQSSRWKQRGCGQRQRWRSPKARQIAGLGFPLGSIEWNSW